MSRCVTSVNGFSSKTEDCLDDQFLCCCYSTDSACTNGARAHAPAFFSFHDRHILKSIPTYQSLEKPGPFDTLSLTCQLHRCGVLWNLKIQSVNTFKMGIRLFQNLVFKSLVETRDSREKSRRDSRLFDNHKSTYIY